MNTNQFNRAVALAKQDRVEVVRVENGQTTVLPDGVWELFEGCALPGFVRVACTIEQVAQLIAYQARYLNGGWDESEIKELREIAKNKFQIYGDPIQDAADERKAERIETRRLALEREREREREDAEAFDTPASIADELTVTLAGSARRRIRLGGL